MQHKRKARLSGRCLLTCSRPLRNGTKTIRIRDRRIKPALTWLPNAIADAAH